MDYELGVLGAGNMAEAIVRAALGKGVLPPEGVIVSDPVEARRQVFAMLGVAATASNLDVIRQSRQALIAVKPQTMPKVAADLAEHGRSDQVLISIMAGITTAKLAATVRPASGGDDQPRIIRVMPNTPMLIGLGMSAVCLGAGAKPGDEALTLKLFGCAGKVIVVGEELMDAVTAVSGSGPAYVCYLAEAMEKAARELGLGDHARLLVAQTVLGAAHLMAESPQTPGELRRKVTSPGGTTEAAVRCLDGAQTTDAIVNAIKAAAARGRELGR